MELKNLIKKLENVTPEIKVYIGIPTGHELELHDLFVEITEQCVLFLLKGGINLEEDP